MKKILEAVYHLFLFKPYTIYPRTFEIALGVLAWLNLFVVIIGICSFF
jgi:hypothetical protein